MPADSTRAAHCNDWKFGISPWSLYISFASRRKERRLSLLHLLTAGCGTLLPFAALQHHGRC
jgi:hypothetical protein